MSPTIIIKKGVPQNAEDDESVRNPKTLLCPIDDLVHYNKVRKKYKGGRSHSKLE